MTDKRDTETSRRGFLGGAVSSAVGLFVGKARGAVSDGLPKIEMGDAGSDPSSNGVIARNGNRLKAYSAGQLIDFADALYPGDDFDGQGVSSFTNLQSVSTGERYIDQISTYAYAGSQTSIPSGTFTQVTLSQTRHDDRGDFDGSNNQIQVSEAGRYAIAGQLQISSVPDGTRTQAELRVNDDVKGKDEDTTGVGSSYPVLTPETEIDLSAGDSVTLYGWQDSGNSLKTGLGDQAVWLLVRQIA